MSDIKLGQLTTSEGRDAIHVAIASVVADERLEPGEHVGLTDEGKANSSVDPIGIVDPFLKHSIGPGQRFWLLLYPNTVTGMRHHWSHPAFKDESAPAVDSGDKLRSENWVKDYVRKHCPFWGGESDGGYGEFLSNVRGREIYYYGMDCHSLGDVEDADELFRHLSVVLGLKIDASYFEAFTCSC